MTQHEQNALNYFGARYLDPMLGMWTSVDPMRQFASPYLYAGNGVNPVNGWDSDGNLYDVKTTQKEEGGGVFIETMDFIDDGDPRVRVTMPDGEKKYFNAPPKDSYFFTEDIEGKEFDITMEGKANAMIAQVDALSIFEWGSNGEYDFKYRYYSRFGKTPEEKRNLVLTVGALNGTIMTARDMGNALWGGYTRNVYLNKIFPNDFIKQMLLLNLISEGVALKEKHFEDFSSLIMQNWGFVKYKP